jgi:hypothetical protein
MRHLIALLLLGAALAAVGCSGSASKNSNTAPFGFAETGKSHHGVTPPPPPGPPPK